MRLKSPAIIAFLLVAGWIPRPALGQPCLGDCDRDREVTADEIVTGITWALGTPPRRECRVFDPNFDGRIDVGDLLGAVMNLLEGCGIESLESLEQRREENQARWQAAQIRDYEIDYQRSCFCLPPSDFRVLVRSGEVFSVHDATTGEAIDPTLSGTYLPNSVDGVFEIIEEAIERRATTLEVDYHPELGYPERVSIDYAFEVADEEIGIRITALRPLREEASLNTHRHLSTTLGL